jgi:arylformamidase
MNPQDTTAEATHQYLTGQLRPTHPALLGDFERGSRAATQALAPTLGIAYGPHPRQTFDLFEGQDGAPTIAYFHAGYWQSRDKSSFRFLAAGWVAAGFSVALVNYPLCPEVDVAGLTEAVRAFPPAFVARMNSSGRSQALVAAGHSAGAHLAVELALTDWRARGLNENPVRAVIGLSGVYDLAPLIDTPLNDKLRLDAGSARVASPLWRVLSGMPPALFAVGGEETGAFVRQTEAMAAAWAAAGNPARVLIAQGADHFSLLSELVGSGGPLGEAILDLARNL